MLLLIDASRANKEQKTGVERYSRNIIQSLKKIIPDYVPVILYSNSPLLGELGVLPKNWTQKILAWNFPFWTQIRFCFEMIKYRNNKDAWLFMMSSAPPFFHPNLIATIHDVGFMRYRDCYSFFNRFLQIFFTKRATKEAKIIFTPSQFSKNEIIDCFKCDEKKIFVVENSADIEPIVKREPDNSILYLGRIERKKNILILVRAFELFKRNKKNDAKLILAGMPGIGFEEIARLISVSDAKDNIVLTEYISDSERYDLLKKARMFVFPSLYEGFGMPILEARESNIPTIASDIPAHREIADSDVVFFKPFDHEELAQKIEKIYFAQKLDIDIKDEAKKRSSWEESAKKMWECISSVANC